MRVGDRVFVPVERSFPRRRNEIATVIGLKNSPNSPPSERYPGGPNIARLRFQADPNNSPGLPNDWWIDYLDLMPNGMDVVFEWLEKNG